MTQAQIAAQIIRSNIGGKVYFPTQESVPYHQRFARKVGPDGKVFLYTVPGYVGRKISKKSTRFVTLQQWLNNASHKKVR